MLPRQLRQDPHGQDHHPRGRVLRHHRQCQVKDPGQGGNCERSLRRDAGIWILQAYWRSSEQLQEAERYMAARSMHRERDGSAHGDERSTMLSMQDSRGYRVGGKAMQQMDTTLHKRSLDLQDPMRSRKQDSDPGAAPPTKTGSIDADYASLCSPRTSSD